MKKLFLVALSIFTLVITVNAQNFEGKISFKISYGELPAEAAGMEDMMPSKMVIYAKNENSRVEMETGLMGTQVTMSNAKDGSTTVLYDMMGQKMAIVMDKAYIEKQKTENNIEKNKIEYLNETKTIAGYKCKKAKIVLTDGGESQTIEIYYTEDIPNYQDTNFEGLKGMPLEFSVNAQGIQMSFTATEIVKEKVADSKFEVPSEYTKVSAEDMEGMMGE